MQTRKAARVLPDPVGAAISVSRPAAISVQPPVCGRVGPSGNRLRNQVWTAGWKVPITPGNCTVTHGRAVNRAAPGVAPGAEPASAYVAAKKLRRACATGCGLPPRSAFHEAAWSAP